MSNAASVKHNTAHDRRVEVIVAAAVGVGIGVSAKANATR
jgi:hypothetical protein